MTFETPQDMSNQAKSRRRDLRARRPRLGTGIFLILLGLLLALNQWHQLPFHDTTRYWPLILIAFGIGRMVDRGPFSPWPHAIILVGLYFELDALGHYDLIRHAWPLGLVWIGLIITLRALRPQPAPASCEWFHE
ncbi:MAG TPA: DUF5668 domain-containing protein [Holophagaceae bacterium]|nr:DUF5668 domain-containing protein [Holophagaceae bacterium]